MEYIKKMIGEELATEKYISRSIKKYEKGVGYIRSMVLGLNDGLVEILAAVAGLAVLAETGIIVVITGVIIGISGTLSMAAGAYLSSKSHGLVEESEEGNDEEVPKRAALYTGVFYFFGSLVPILPFVWLSGFDGIIAAITTVSIVLFIASYIIATISGTSVRKRAFEMLVISLGAAFVTILLAMFVKAEFGITI